MLEKIHGAIWIGGSQMALLVSNLLLLKLLTSRLNVSDFGYYSLCMSIVLFARQVIYDSFSMVIAKNCSSNISDERKLSLGFEVVRYFTDRVGVLIFFAGALFFISNYYLAANDKLAVAFFLCSVYLLANGAQGIYFNVLNSIGDRKSASLFAMTDSILKLALAFLFLNLIQGSLSSALQSISIGALFVLGIIRKFVRAEISRDEAPVLNIKYAVHENLVICLPLLLPALLNAFRSIGDRWMLAAFMGVDELAIYSVLLQLGYFPLVLIFGVAQTYIGPDVYRLCRFQNRIDYVMLKRLVLGILLATTSFSIVSGGVALMLADFVFDILVGSEYKIFSGYLSSFVVAGSFAAGAGLLQLVVFGLFDTRIASKLIAVSIGFSLVVAFVLIYTLQFVGAIVGLVLAGLIPLLIFAIAVYRKLL
jgi:O-antigen/teichoic acid export membrane protein